MKTTAVLIRLLFFTWFCLAACSSVQSTVVPTGTRLPKTLIPERIDVTPQIPLTPKPVDITLSTRAGQEIHFERFMLEPNEYVAFHTESVPQGIPLANGVEVKLDYLQQVDFDLPSKDWEESSDGGKWNVILFLTDGTQMHTELGFKARHKLRVTGYSNLGYVEIELIDVKRMVFQRTSPALPILQEIAGKGSITVETQNGERIRVANPKVFTRCMYEVYCCHDETLEKIPLQGRNDLALNAIQSVTFSGNESAVIVLADGNHADAKIRLSNVCPQTLWRLRGQAALGDFEIELSAVKEIRN